MTGFALILCGAVGLFILASMFSDLILIRSDFRMRAQRERQASKIRARQSVAQFHTFVTHLKGVNGEWEAEPSVVWSGSKSDPIPDQVAHAGHLSEPRLISPRH